MSHHSTFSRLGAIFVVFALIVAVGASSLAATNGTRAGAKISSSASATYNDKTGGGGYSTSAAVVSIYVAEKPASSLTAVTANQENYDGSYVVYAITVANNGNFGDAFAMEPVVTSGTAYLDSVGWYADAGLTQALGGSAKNIMRDTVTAEVGSNTTTVYAKVYLKADGTYPAFDNQNIVIAFQSRSTTNNSDTTHLTLDGFATIVVNPTYLNATSSQVSRTTRVKESILALNTTSNTASNRPGTVVSYRFTVANSGHGGTQSTIVRVDYPGNTAFSSGTNWTNNLTYATYTIAGNINAGATYSLPTTDSLRLAITDAGTVLEGSTIQPTQSISYQDTTGTARTRLNTSNTPTTTVAFKAYAPTITLVDSTLTGDPGDTVTVIYTIQNNSNGVDAYNVRYSTASQLPASWTFVDYYDKNGNNAFDAGTDSLFAAGGISGRTTKRIDRSASTTIFLRAAIPSGLTLTPVHVVNLASSYRDSVTTGDFTLAAQVTPLLPNITVGRARVILSDSTGSGTNIATLPGGKVEFYTYVSNTGTGQANSVVITDAGTNFASTTRQDSVLIFDGTTEVAVAGIITSLGNPQSNGGYTVTATASNYTINLGNLAAGASRRIRYYVVVN